MLMLVFGLFSSSVVCFGSANGSKAVLWSRLEEAGRLGPSVCDPRVVGSAGGNAEQQGKWEHLCRSVAARQA